jgi:hypothetical protein
MDMVKWTYFPGYVSVFVHPLKKIKAIKVKKIIKRINHLVCYADGEDHQRPRHKRLQGIDSIGFLGVRQAPREFFRVAASHGVVWPPTALTAQGSFWSSPKLGKPVGRCCPFAGLGCQPRTGR